MFWRFRRVFATDGEIDLIPIDLYPPEDELQFGENYDFVICPHGQRREAGRISLRTGESNAVYYFGHIGYHIEPAWRGHHWAMKACKLLLPLMRHRGMRSCVITTDPDNTASRKTCEHLGCVLENIRPVPGEYQHRWQLSPAKCRYIWNISDIK